MNCWSEVELWLRALSRHTYAWLAVIAVVFAIQISSQWLPTPDSNAYLSIARNIALHHELRMLGYAHLAYPPGYPLLVSVAFLFSPLPFLQISIIQWVMTLLFMIGLYKWMQRQAGQAALLLTALVMANVTFWIYYRLALSEIAFMTVAIWSVLFLDRALDITSDQRVADTFFGVVLLMLLTLIREVGFLFGPAVLVLLFLRFRAGQMPIRTAIVVAASILLPITCALATFLIYTQLTFAQTHIFGTHLSGLLDTHISIWRRIADGVRLQIYGTGRLIIPGMFKAYSHSWLSIDTLIYFPVFVLLAVGWRRWVADRPDVYALVVPFYLLVYIIWDFDADTRYLLPLLPAMVASLWYATEQIRSREFTLLAAFALLHLTISLSYWALVEIPQAQRCTAQWKPVFALTDSIKAAKGEIAALRDVPRCVQLMFSFALDRPVYDLRVNPSWLGEADWLLVQSQAPSISGFRLKYVSGDYALLLREPAIASR